MPESTQPHRISAPDPATLDVAQKAIFDAQVRAFGGPLGPRIPLMHSPELVVAWHQMGVALKNSALKPVFRELAILVVGQYWRASFEWYAHAPIAAREGITQEQLDDLKMGKTPDFANPELQLVYSYCRELVLSRKVCDTTYDRTKQLLGERLLVELTALLGHFTNVAMTLNSHHVPLPPGVPSPFVGLDPEPESYRTGWIEIDGASLRYRYRSGDGPTLVFVHELGGSIESWDACIDLLPRNRSVLCFEWRGAGLSTKIHGPIAFELLVNDLQRVVSAVGGAGPFVLIGVAAGAGIAISYAARFPQQVAGLIAFVPALGTPLAQRSGVAEAADRIERDGMQTMMAMERTYPSNLRTEHPERWTDFKRRYMGNDGRSYAHLLRMVMAIDVSEDVKRIQCPALVVGGRYDVRPLEMMQTLAGQMPKGAFDVIQAGHFMPSQVPDLVAEAIEKFAVTLSTTTTKGA